MKTNNGIVLVVVYDQVEEDGRAIRQIETLVKAGYKVEVIGTNTSYENSSVAVHSFASNRGGLEWLKFSIRTLNFIRRRKNTIQFLFLQNFPLVIVGLLSKLFFRVEWVYDAYENLIPSRRYHVRKYLLLYLMEKFTIKSAALVVSANYERMRLLKGVYGIKNVTYVKNIVHSNAIKCKRPFRVPSCDDNFTVLYQGFIDDERNLKLFIKSLLYLPNHYVLKVIGDGSQLPELRCLVDELKLNSRVIFLGRLAYDKMLEETISADLGIVYYKSIDLNTYYCSPNKIYEYSNMNIPFVSSPQPMFKEILQKYKIGEFIPDSFTPNEVANAIRKISYEYSSYLTDFDRFNKDYNSLNEENRLINELANTFKVTHN